MTRKMGAEERKAHLRKMFAHLRPVEKAEIREVLSESGVMAQTAPELKPEAVIPFQNGFTLRQ